MSCLLAVTTDLPNSSADRTHSYAGCRPPTSSTMTSASLFRMSSTSSVHVTDVGTQSTRLAAMRRLKMPRSSMLGTWPSHRILATDWPTVPNPSSPTRIVSLAGDTIRLRVHSRPRQPAVLRFRSPGARARGVRVPRPVVRARAHARRWSYLPGPLIRLPCRLLNHGEKKKGPSPFQVMALVESLFLSLAL